VLLVCDRTKVDRAAPVRIGHMSEIHAFVTDRLTSARLREVCSTHHVKVIETATEEVVSSLSPLGDPAR
jgi:DeoR family glycerol-3-phosphate regulon repressor